LLFFSAHLVFLYFLFLFLFLFPAVPAALRKGGQKQKKESAEIAQIFAVEEFPEVEGSGPAQDVNKQGAEVAAILKESEQQAPTPEKKKKRNKKQKTAQSTPTPTTTTTVTTTTVKPAVHEKAQSAVSREAEGGGCV
jgi:hypothetical protein